MHRTTLENSVADVPVVPDEVDRLVGGGDHLHVPLPTRELVRLPGVVDERLAGTDDGRDLHSDPELSVVVPGANEGAVGNASRLRILIGGEHSVSNAAFRAHAAHADEITVVQLDAHADLRQDDSDYHDRPWGPYAHCSVMRRAHDLGYRLVQVGVRAYSAEERELFGDPRITVFEWGRRTPSVEEVVDAIPTERIYLTLDVDGLDPACMPATGTPVPGGLDWYYTMNLLAAVTRSRRLVGADVVEVCPRVGDSRTEYAAAQIVYSLLGLTSRPRLP